MALLIFVGLLLSTLSCGASQPLDPTCAAFYQHMLSLKNAAGIDCPGEDLFQLNTCFQGNFMNKGERFHQSNTGHVNPQLVALYSSFDRLLQPLLPLKMHYDKVVLLGSTFPNMQHRVQWLLELYGQGLRFNQLIFLGSDRPMDPLTESKEVLKNYNYKDLMTRWIGNVSFPRTETEAAQFIVDRISWPTNFPSMVFLNTPCPPAQRRATTSDTIVTLRAQRDLMEEIQSLLFISSQPFALKQAEDIRSELGAGIFFDMAADDVLIHMYGVDTPFAQKNLNDNSAKLLYQTLQNHYKGRSTCCPILKKEEHHNAL